MSFAAEIKGLIEEGYGYDDILETFVEVAPHLQDEIGTLTQEGYSPEDIISTFLEVEEAGPRQTQSGAEDIATGALLGGLDIADLGGLLQAAIQAPLTYGLLTPEQREEVATPGMKARAELETSPELSEKDFIALAGEDDDLIGLPILPGQRRALARAKEKIPQGGKLQEIARRGTRAAPFVLGGGGALATALGSEYTGLGGREVAKALGFGELGQTVADIGAGIYGGGKVAQALGQRAIKGAEETVPRIAREAEKGLERQLTKADILANPKKVQNDISKISSQAIKQYEGNAGRLAEPAYTPANFNAREIESEIVNQTKEAALNAISPPERSETAWNRIAEGVNTELAAERAYYRNLYRASEKEARGLNYTFSKTAREAQNLLDDLGRLATKSKGQPELERALQSTLKDVGIQPKEGDFAKLVNNVLKEYKGQTISAEDLQQLLRGQAPISVDKAMALKRSLNDIVNYEELAPSIKDLLRPLIKTLKGETLEALEQRPLVKSAYQKAESQFAKTAETFDKDAINFLRAKDAPETASSRFLIGSNLKYLKNALKNSPDQWNAVEAQVVREISKKSVDAGRDILREVEPYLSKGSREIAKDLIGFGDRLTSPGAQDLMRGKLLESIQAAASSGERPEYALKLMQNPTGYKFTENILNKSPKGKQMWKALQQQSVDDVFRSILDKNNAIDFTKAKNLIKNSHVEKIIKDAVGEEGLKFFKQLEGYGKNITKNLEEFGRKAPPTLREQLVSSTGLFLKSLLYSLVGGKAALGAYLGIKVIPKFSKSLYYKMLSSRRMQDMIKKLSKPETWKGSQLIPTLEKLNTEVNRETER